MSWTKLQRAALELGASKEAVAEGVRFYLVPEVFKTNPFEIKPCWVIDAGVARFVNDNWDRDPKKYLVDPHYSPDWTMSGFAWGVTERQEALPIFFAKVFGEQPALFENRDPLDVHLCPHNDHVSITRTSLRRGGTGQWRLDPGYSPAEFKLTFCPFCGVELPKGEQVKREWPDGVQDEQ